MWDWPIHWTIHRRPSTTNIRLLSLGNERNTKVSACVRESQSPESANIRSHHVYEVLFLHSLLPTGPRELPLGLLEMSLRAKPMTGEEERSASVMPVLQFLFLLCENSLRNTLIICALLWMYTIFSGTAFHWGRVHNSLSQYLQNLSVHQQINE